MARRRRSANGRNARDRTRVAGAVRLGEIFGLLPQVLKAGPLGKPSSGHSELLFVRLRPSVQVKEIALWLCNGAQRAWRFPRTGRRPAASTWPMPSRLATHKLAPRVLLLDADHPPDSTGQDHGGGSFPQPPMSSDVLCRWCSASAERRAPAQLLRSVTAPRQGLLPWGITP
jgi:hypothetical protein